MSRIIILDTFPLSSTGKRESPANDAPSLLDLCQQWIHECVRAGNRVVAPGISYYEAVRELERLGAARQIARLHTFCHAVADRYLPITNDDMRLAAKLWARARNAGTPTSGMEALDGNVILAAQALSLAVPLSELVIATTNVRHLSQFVPADLWTNIVP